MQDRISLIIKDLLTRQMDLKVLKKSIRDMEKCLDEEYLELKKAAKDLKDQAKAYEERFKDDLMGDTNYVELLKLKMEAEEKIAQDNQKLFELITEMPPKPINFKLDLEEGNMNIDIMPEMRVYLNGREEKKRA